MSRLKVGSIGLGGQFPNRREGNRNQAQKLPHILFSTCIRDEKLEILLLRLKSKECLTIENGKGASPFFLTRITSRHSTEAIRGSALLNSFSALKDRN